MSETRAMESAKGVLLLTKEPDTARAVTSALEGARRLVSAGICRTLREMVAELERHPAAAALVDIDPDPSRMLAEMAPIVGRFADVRFIVLSKELRSDLILEAMQVGTRHFLAKSLIPDDLANVLKRLVPTSRGRRGDRGSLITVLSASGGCGATTLTINLANELGIAASSPSLVVDMDCNYGAVAACLGISGEYGLADVLSREGDIDDELVATTTITHSPSLHVLLSPAGVNPFDPAPLQYDRLDVATDIFRFTYAHTVVDAARVPMPVATSLASASSLVLLVFQLNIKDVAMARAMLGGLNRRGISSQAVVPLVNRYHKRRHMIGLEEAQKALGTGVRHVSNDFRSAMRSVNYGQPLAQVAPRSPMRRDIRGMAIEFIKANSEQVRGATKVEK